MNLPEGWTYHILVNEYEYIMYSSERGSDSPIFRFCRDSIMTDKELHWLHGYLKCCNSHGFCYWKDGEVCPEPMPEEITTWEQAFQYGYTLWRMT